MPDHGQTKCPICNGDRLPADVSVVDREKTTAVIQGRINAVIQPGEAHYPPFSTFYTATVYPRKGSVKYLKFQTRRELDKCDLAVDDKVEIEGCLHIVDGKNLVFAVRSVRVDPAK